MKIFEDRETDRRFGRMQWRMLFATMIGYTLFYFMRKNFSFAMPGLQQDCGVSKSMLGNFLFWGGIVYGLSKFVNGIVGDRVNPKKMLCFGLLACTLVNVAFGFAPEIAARLGNGEQGTGNGAALVWTFGLLLVLNQFFQGTGFPPCAKLIAFWIPPKELATKMSVWNTSHSIGGGLVAKICGVIMGLGVIGSANQGVGMWRWCFWAMAILGGLGLLLMVLWLPGTPKDEGLPDLPGTEADGLGKRHGTLDDGVTRYNSTGSSAMKMVFLNPVIWMLGFINFTINATRALFAGWATDRFFGGRAPRLSVFLMALTAALFAAFWFMPAGIGGAAALCAGGFCLYGPQALTGVTATNLATKRHAGTAIGFISLFSYAGVSVAGKVCGDLAQSSGGWRLPLLVMVAVAAAGALLFACLWQARPHAYAEQ